MENSEDEQDDIKEEVVVTKEMISECLSQIKEVLPPKNYTFSLLDLTNKNITDFSSQSSYIASCTNLLTILIADNKITDISCFSDLPNLTTIDARNNKISLFGSGFSKLTHLNVDGNDLTSLSQLPILQNLQVLSAANNKITSFEGFVPSATLIEINLENNSLRSLDGLKESCNIINLIASNNQLENFSSISLFPQLRTLLLKNNSFSSIEGIGPLPHLQTLDLGENNLNSLEDIRRDSYNLKSLRSIDISGNESLPDNFEFDGISIPIHIYLLSANRRLFTVNKENITIEDRFSADKFIADEIQRIKEVEEERIKMEKKLQAGKEEQERIEALEAQEEAERLESEKREKEAKEKDKNTSDDSSDESD